MTREDLDRWLTDYGAAWEARDGEEAAALFGDDGSYCWGPHEPPLRGRDAIRERWTEATRDQRNVSFRHELLGIDGNRGFARWWTTFDEEALHFELDGVFVLDFADNGLCSQLQEWWAAVETPLG